MEQDEVGLARAYLLGELSETELRAFEERLMVDTKSWEETLEAENTLIDEYVEDRLNEGDRIRLEERFLSSAEGREQINFTRALKAYASKIRPSGPVVVSPRQRLSFVQWRRWAPIAAGILTLIAGVGVWRGFFHAKSEIEKGFIALNNAYPEERPVEARITGMQYKPRLDPRGAGQSRIDELNRLKAELIFTTEAMENPDTQAFHALGQYYLAEKDFDRAITQFNKALELTPANAQTNSDLGAVLFERGKAEEGDDPGRSAEDLVRSLEQFNKALELNPGLLAARFNRALLYQHTSKLEEAAADWKAYLVGDPDSDWANEAKTNQALVEERKKRRS